MLETLSGRALRSAPSTPQSSPRKGKAKIEDIPISPNEIDSEAVDRLLASKSGQSTIRARWSHNKSVSSAYWDPRGRTIVSTSYDDNIRCEWLLEHA